MGRDTDIRARRERELFLDALEIQDPAERQAFLDRECAGEVELRASIEALLQNHFEDDFLQAAEGIDRWVGTARGRAKAEGAEFPPEGKVIGRFHLLKRLGEGGCGAVYLAEQQAPVRRRVALKLIKLGMDSPGVIARFEAEQQALAMMDHPNIARVLEAGSTEMGRPFFVMELVEGVRITEFCQKYGLSLTERLQLFILVCDAVQHAHQKGIIHRDLKPSNVLVVQQGAVPTPKVIDFGIAKAVGQRLTDKTLHTGFHFFVGTPAYTSPEQAQMGALDVDTRSDIYSLGVVLYELLTGKPPFDPERLSQVGFDEMRRIIREEEPQRPSNRLHTQEAASAKPELENAAPSRVPLHPVDEIAVDLDWVVMKCLEKDRARRYETARDLALDLQRFLSNEPISARPPSANYRVYKFIRRNQVMVGAATLVLATLLIATGVSLRQAYRATQAEAEQNQLRIAAEAAQLREFEQLQQAKGDRYAALRQAYNSDMNLVQQALAVHNYGRAAYLLDRHRPLNGQTDFRQWEWRFYWNQVRSSSAQELPRQNSRILCLTASPDGRILATGDEKGALKVWDAMERKELGVLTERGGRVELAKFSKDGRLLATLSREAGGIAQLRIWSVGGKRLIARAPVPFGSFGVGFREGDSRVHFLGPDSVQHDWDFAREPGGNPGWLRSARAIGASGAASVLSDDGRFLATAGELGAVSVYSVENGTRLATVTPYSAPPAAMAFSPDGAVLAVSPSFSVEETSVKLFETKTGTPLGQLQGNGSWVPCLAFSPDGQSLASGGADQIVRIWDVRGKSELAAFRGHLAEVHSLCWLAEGKALVTGAKDGALLLWETRQVENRAQYEVIPGRTVQLAFFKDREGFLTLSDDGLIRAWTGELRGGDVATRLGKGIEAVQIDAERAFVFVASKGRGIQVYDWATRTVVTNLPLQDALVGAWDLQLCGNQLVALNPESGVRVWDVRTWQPRAQWQPQQRAWSSYALSADGRSLALPGSGEHIDLYSVTEGQLTGSVVSAPSGLGPMAYSSDGRYFAHASLAGTFALWDAAPMQILDELRGHLLGIHGLLFSPDSQRLVSASLGKEAIKLWDVETRHEVATLSATGGAYTRLTFSPEGTYLVAINAQNAAHVWRAPSLAQIDKLYPRPVETTPAINRP